MKVTPTTPADAASFLDYQIEKPASVNEGTPSKRRRFLPSANLLKPSPSPSHLTLMVLHSSKKNCVVGRYVPFLGRRKRRALDRLFHDLLPLYTPDYFSS